LRSAEECTLRKAAVLALLALASCSTVRPAFRPLRPLAIATMPYQWTATTAMTGTLLYEGGCLLFHDEAGGALYVPVWPYGTVFNGEAVVMHVPGKVDEPVQIAQELVLYGRPLAPPLAPSIAPFERQCDEPPVGVVGVRPAD
jgi:hypothetical protein